MWSVLPKKKNTPRNLPGAPRGLQAKEVEVPGNLMDASVLPCMLGRGGRPVGSRVELSRLWRKPGGPGRVTKRKVEVIGESPLCGKGVTHPLPETLLTAITTIVPGGACWKEPGSWGVSRCIPPLQQRGLLQRTTGVAPNDLEVTCHSNRYQTRPMGPRRVACDLGPSGRELSSSILMRPYVFGWQSRNVCVRILWTPKRHFDGFFGEKQTHPILRLSFSFSARQALGYSTFGAGGFFGDSEKALSRARPGTARCFAGAGEGWDVW